MPLGILTCHGLVSLLPVYTNVECTLTFAVFARRRSTTSLFSEALFSKTSAEAHVSFRCYIPCCRTLRLTSPCHVVELIHLVSSGWYMQ
ncbi:hypothetical protein L208DRAFT_877346 [Tricholoma matsutake]|nr:hypothetical protein L208DRAFT_877346 [Tricholoma matsutake 945]